MVHTRRHLPLLAASLALAALVRPARAQSPESLSLVVPFAEGGAADLVGRLLAHGLEERLGHRVNVVNIPGRSGIVGAGIVARARPDGRTLLMTSNSTYLTAAAFCGALPYDADDLAPLGLLATNALVLCVPRHGPVPDLAGLLQAVRGRAAPLEISSLGFGSTSHLTMALLARRADFSIEHRGAGSAQRAVQMVLAGEAEATFSNASVALPYVSAGSLTALAVSSVLRLPRLPQVPTLDEAGFPGFQASTDFALFAPAGTPAAAMHRLELASQAVMRAAATRHQLAISAMLPVGSGAAEFVRYMAHERAQWRELLEEHRPMASAEDC